MAKRILHHRKQFALIARLGKYQSIRREPGLFKTRGVKIEPRKCPQHRRQRRCARRDPGEKQRRRGILGKAWRRSGDLMQSADCQPLVSQPVVDRLDAERHYTTDARRRVERGDTPSEIGDRIEAGSGFHQDS